MRFVRPSSLFQKNTSIFLAASTVRGGVCAVLRRFSVAHGVLHLMLRPPPLLFMDLVKPVPGAVPGAQGPAAGDRVHLQPRRVRSGGEAGVFVVDDLVYSPVDSPVDGVVVV